MIQSLIRLTTGCLFAGVIVSAVGCETGVDPIAGEDRPYTLWGVLDIGADTQRVRVFTIEGYPGIDRSGSIDADVISTDLTIGDRREWMHREIAYDNGDVAHVFWSAFRAVPGHRYQIEVMRSDGVSSSAVVSVPDVADVDVTIRTDSAYVPIVIRGDSISVIGMGMRYEATNVPPLNAPEGVPLFPAVFHPVEVSYDGKGSRIDDGGWAFMIDMYADAGDVFAEYARNCLITTENPDIALRRVELHFVIASADWAPPGGVFDPDELVEPGRLSNVENGFGFIGAGELIRYRWTPSANIRYDLGYRYERKDFSLNPPIPCVDSEPVSVWDYYF